MQIRRKKIRRIGYSYVYWKSIDIYPMKYQSDMNPKKHILRRVWQLSFYICLKRLGL